MIEVTSVPRMSMIGDKSVSLRSMIRKRSYWAMSKFKSSALHERTTRMNPRPRHVVVLSLAKATFLTRGYHHDRIWMWKFRRKTAALRSADRISPTWEPPVIGRALLFRTRKYCITE
jgi:hypothetical protein